MFQLKTASSLRGTIEIPGDKSISHRSVMFGALAKGTTNVRHFLNGADCLSTISCFRQMGINIDQNGQEVSIHGKGMHGLSAPAELLDTGNSGTTTRLLSGILAAQPFVSTLNGDASIQKRPMKRIMTPLREMGANIISLKDNDCAPLKITGAPLHGIRYTSPVASAQVKSAILLAGLYADGKTSVTEPSLSRDHTERMLRQFGADMETSGTTATISPCKELYATDILVPGDISSAAYFMVAASILPGSEVLIKNVGINNTRAGILKVLRQMGADITEIHTYEGSEPAADLLVRYAPLRGLTVEGDIIPTLIDEIPILSVAAAMAEGTTVIKDAAELKVKESDRILTVTKMLRHFGVDITPTDDGFIIEGGKPIVYDNNGPIESYLDHRIAMSAAIVTLLCDRSVPIDDFSCVSISFPTFEKLLDTLSN